MSQGVTVMQEIILNPKYNYKSIYRIIDQNNEGWDTTYTSWRAAVNDMLGCFGVEEAIEKEAGMTSIQFIKEYGEQAWDDYCYETAKSVLITQGYRVVEDPA